MSPNAIESFFHAGEGYNPFLIRDGWQVAQLNFLPGHELTDIGRMEMHSRTDEAFVLVKGNAMLIAVRSWDGFIVECIRMKPGVTYNVPAGLWHNIAMDVDAQLIIIEKSNTHLDDVVYRDLTATERKKLYA